MTSECWHVGLDMNLSCFLEWVLSLDLVAQSSLCSGLLIFSLSKKLSPFRFQLRWWCLPIQCLVCLFHGRLFNLSRDVLDIFFWFNSFSKKLIARIYKVGTVIRVIINHAIEQTIMATRDATLSIFHDKGVMDHI